MDDLNTAARPIAHRPDDLRDHAQAFTIKETFMLYELRTYFCMPGRLPDLNKRFETITLNIWKKHGIVPVAFWTNVIGESNATLIYVLQWDSLADRERKWNAFATDPEWLSARAETEKNGPLISHFSNSIMAPTTYSPLK